MQIATVIMHPDKNRTPIEVQGPPGHLLVRSTFLTIQGEGPYAWMTAYFIRLAGCNLGAKQAYCQGCDTDFLPSRSSMLPISALVNEYHEVTKDLPGAKPGVVITGGEPSLHEQLPELVAAFNIEPRGLRPSWVQIESNGFDLDVLARAQSLGADIVLSPKVSAKGYVGKALVPQFSEAGLFLETSAGVPPLQLDEGTASFKYVVSADPVNAHHKLPEWVTDPKRPEELCVYVSPATVYLRQYEGETSSAWDASLVNQKETAANYAYAAKLALQYNLRLSIQTHTFLAVP